MADTPSYATDIKSLFREEDQKAMEFVFDLWDYQDVVDNAQAIHDEVAAGGMPCDGAWGPEKVELFKLWMDTGMGE